MKKLTLLIFLLLLFHMSYSQNADNRDGAVMKPLTWNFKKAPEGTTMYMLIPYSRDNAESVENLLVGVAKRKSKLRPDMITVVCPSNVAHANGILIRFAKTSITNGKQSTVVANQKPLRLTFDHCNDETCTLQIINSYAADQDGKQEDIFQKFLDFDQIIFVLSYQDGTTKAIVVPLFSFQDEYKNLE